MNATFLLALFSLAHANSEPPADPISLKISDTAKSRIQATFLKAPLHFEPNQGQTDEQVKFIARGGGYSLFLTATEAVMVLRKQQEKQTSISGHSIRHQLTRNSKPETRNFSESVVRMKLVGANADAEVVGLQELPGKVNYFKGNDSKKWRTNIPTYKRVEYNDVYPGINLVYYGNQGQLEYDFVVSPGASPSAIQLAFEGSEKVEIDTKGDLILKIASGNLRLHKPLVYQEVAGVRREISAAFVLNPKSKTGTELSRNIENQKLASVGFQLDAYESSKPLVIDPVLSYSTYLGGNGNEVGGTIAVDSSGSAYVLGATSSSNFPITPGVYHTFYRGDSDIFVTKLNSDGSGLVYSTYIGGGTNEGGTAITVDSVGNAYVVGGTASGDFPTVNAFQNSFGGGSNNALFLKLNAQGSELLYSTYLGGNGGVDRGGGIAVDSSGNAYISGRAESTNFPTTPGAFQTTYGGALDVFVAKIDPSQVGAASLIYSTYLGGSGTEADSSIAVDSFGNAYVTGFTTSTNFPTVNGFQSILGGHDDFVTKINSGGSALLYSTYLGGSGSETGDGGGIAVDSSGNIYVAGCTGSPDFPTKNALQPVYGGGTNDAYVVKINPSQAGVDSLVYSTFLGGSGDECGRFTFGRIAVDTFGNAYLTGLTNSTDFPTTPGAFQASNGGGADTFVAKLSTSGSTLSYSTYLGGSHDDVALGIAVDIAGNTFIAGMTGSTNFPVTSGAFQTVFAGGEFDAFVAKIATPVDDRGPITFEVMASPNPVAVNTLVTLTAKADDTSTGGSNITSAEYRIDGGPYMPMTAQDGDFDEPVETVTAATGPFTSAGVYSLCVRGTDAGVNAGSEECIYLAVFDPNAGFVTGGGWINSPAGAYTANPSLTGRANFGFVSRYRRGANVPEGQTEFQFSVANLNFHSASYEWLVVGGARAQYKGTGTINGAGSYSFILTAIDGQVAGGGGVDKFRIKVWEPGGVIYDNQMGASDAADPTTQIGGGSIMIRRQ